MRKLIPLFLTAALLSGCAGDPSDMSAVIVITGEGEPTPEGKTALAPTATSDSVVVVTESEAPDLNERCLMYLQVLEDLWEKDPGLNEGVEIFGVDFQELTHLTEEERGLVAQAFADAHGVQLVEGTWAELVEEGYISSEPITTRGNGIVDEDPYYSFRWEDGMHFTLRTQEDTVWNLPMLTEGEEAPELTGFTAQKWRSSLGAYGFSDCVGRMGEDGSWSYTVGAEFIS